MDSEEHICNPDIEWGVPVVLNVVLHVCVCTHKIVVCVLSADSFSSAMKAIWF